MATVLLVHACAAGWKSAESDMGSKLVNLKATALQAVMHFGLALALCCSVPKVQHCLCD